MEYQVTKSWILESATITELRELAVRHLGMTDDGVTKTANAADRTKNRGESQAPYMKLRKAILTKMDNGFGESHPSWAADGVVTLDFACMEPAPEPEQAEQAASDEPAFGANKGARKAKAEGKKAPAHRGPVPRTGGYTVNKRPTSPSVNGGDAGKWEIWEHVWACSSFEEFFASAPAKAVAKTGRVVTAASEMGWALKQGWITINE